MCFIVNKTVLYNNLPASNTNRLKRKNVSLLNKAL